MRSWYRSPWFIGPALTLVGGAVGLGAVAIAMRPRGSVQVFRNLVQTGPLDFESHVGTTRLIFPAESWTKSHYSGMDFKSSLGKVLPQAWDLIASVARELGLSEIYFTSMYRPTGTGPHTTGRALDVGYIRRGSDPLVLLLRDNGSPVQEPELARAFRQSLVSHGATQVLTPWWIYSKGTRDDPNNMQGELDAGHQSHLHITVPA